MRVALCIVASLSVGACSILAGAVASDLPEDADPTGADSGIGDETDAVNSFCYRISPGCPDGWETLQGSCSCYLARDNESTAAGHNYCKAIGAHLLAIESLAEQNAIDQQLSGGGSDFYLGLFYNGAEWQWDTGETLQETGFSALVSQAPPSFGRECVELDKDEGAHWFPASCDDNDYVCELDGKTASDSPPIF